MIDDIEEILHPTDFSEPAQNAFEYAMEIAHKNESRLVIMHSAKQAYTYGSDEMMKKLISQTKYGDLSLETDIEIGNTIPNILNSTADFIVIGSTGETSIEKVLFGSVSSEVILKAEVPVLVIPKDREYSGFSNLIFATDYHDRDLEILNHLVQWAELFDAEITVLHVTREKNLESRAKFRGLKELAGEKIDYQQLNFRLLCEKDFYTGISSFLNDKNEELLVMSRNKEAFFRNLVETKLFQQPMYSEVPLLIYPGDKEI